jgi:hypothetical protein
MSETGTPAAATPDDHRGLWPALDAPGRYEIECSCSRFRISGTPAEIRAASRGHDDSPKRNHLVVIMHGGRRTDMPDPNVPGLDAGPHYGEAAFMDDEIGGMT